MDEAKVAIGGFVVSGGQSEGADRLVTNVVKGCRLEDIVHQLMPAAGIGIFNFHYQN